MNDDLKRLAPALAFRQPLFGSPIGGRRLLAERKPLSGLALGSPALGLGFQRAPVPGSLQGRYVAAWTWEWVAFSVPLLCHLLWRARRSLVGYGELWCAGAPSAVVSTGTRLGGAKAMGPLRSVATCGPLSGCGRSSRARRGRQYGDPRSPGMQGALTYSRMRPRWRGAVVKKCEAPHQMPCPRQTEREPPPRFRKSPRSGRLAAIRRYHRKSH